MVKAMNEPAARIVQTTAKSHVSRFVIGAEGAAESEALTMEWRAGR
jgi:hypothetical protein